MNVKLRTHLLSDIKKNPMKYGIYRIDTVGNKTKVWICFNMRLPLSSREYDEYSWKEEYVWGYLEIENLETIVFGEVWRSVGKDYEEGDDIDIIIAEPLSLCGYTIYSGINYIRYYCGFKDISDSGDYDYIEELEVKNPQWLLYQCGYFSDPDYEFIKRVDPDKDSIQVAINSIKRIFQLS